MSEKNHHEDLDHLGRSLGRGLRGAEEKGAPLGLRARIRAAIGQRPLVARWKWAAACVGFLLVLGAALIWFSAQPQSRHVAATGAQAENVALLEREALRPLLLLDAAREVEEENQFLAVELYREACSTATHPAVAWLAANEVRRLEGNEF